MTSISSLRQRTSDDLVKRGLAALEAMRKEPSEQNLPTTETIVRLAEHLAAEAAPIAKLRIEPKTSRKLFGHPFEIGESRLSADPDLPDTLEWPTQNGIELDCLAQIDLAKLPTATQWPVPKQGWLYIFLGGEDSATIVLKYFDGPLEALKRRRRKPVTSLLGFKRTATTYSDFMEHGARNAPPYSINFELGLIVRDSSAEPWNAEIYKNANTWNMISVLRPDPEVKAWMFGAHLYPYVGHDTDSGTRLDGGDAKLRAVITSAGFPGWARLLSYGQLPEAFDGGTPEQEAEYARLLRRLPEFKSEAEHWGPIFSLPSLLHGSTGWGDGTWHYIWGDARTLHLFADLRKASAGDFSGATYLIY